jgi:hypothetical protein
MHQIESWTSAATELKWVEYHVAESSGANRKIYFMKKYSINKKKRNLRNNVIW